VTTALPTELQVEVTGACNLACKMCLVRYRPKLGRTSGAMCFHTFRDLVDALPGLEKLTLQGLGEPLLAPDFFRMVEYATARGVRTGFNTNGTFLTPERVRTPGQGRRRLPPRLARRATKATELGVELRLPRLREPRSRPRFRAASAATGRSRRPT
jgi:uncharacterized radical SAM superfamily Fe-S cluster-containing enzyme